ncbi:MAG: hypothetical protein ACF8PN_06740 [Phycisphaerales bacterium]
MDTAYLKPEDLNSRESIRALKAADLIVAVGFEGTMDVIPLYCTEQRPQRIAHVQIPHGDEDVLQAACNATRRAKGRCSYLTPIELELMEFPHGLNMAKVNQRLFDVAVDAYERRDVEGFVDCRKDSESALEHVLLNLEPLCSVGMFEQAFFLAFIDAKFSNWWITPNELLGIIRSHCDPAKLRRAGDPPPATAPWTVYRGVYGPADRRVELGLSWSASLDCACKFATAFDEPSPAVFVAEMREEDLLFYTNYRFEFEYVGRPERCTPMELCRDEMMERAERCRADPRELVGEPMSAPLRTGR